MDEKLLECPFCNAKLIKKNDGHGRYYECENKDAVLYNMPSLIRRGYDEVKLKGIHQKAKRDITHFGSICGNCGHNYHEVKFDLEDYHTIIFVCTNCFEFVFHKRDLHLFKKDTKIISDDISSEASKVIEKEEYKINQEIESKKSTNKFIKSSSQNILNEMDKKLKNDKQKWEKYDKAIKFSTSKTIGAYLLIIFIILSFVRISYRFAPSSTKSVIGMIIFIILIFAGIIFLLIRKINLKNIKDKYFDDKRK